MWEAIKSGGLSEDLQRIKGFFSDRLGGFGDDEAGKLERRRKNWMKKLAEADKPKETDNRKKEVKDTFTNDLTELFDGIAELEKKSSENAKAD